MPPTSSLSSKATFVPIVLLLLCCKNKTGPSTPSLYLVAKIGFAVLSVSISTALKVETPGFTINF